MPVREAIPEDYAELDRIILAHQWSRTMPDLSRDRLIVTGPVGRPDSLLVWRPAAFVLHVWIKESLAQDAHATRLIAGAIALGRSRPTPIEHAVFQVDPQNERMLRYHEKIGSKKETGVVMSYRFPAK